MKPTNLKHVVLPALLLLCVSAASVAAQQNVYDKFRNRTYTNDGLLSEQDELKLGNEVHQQLLNPPAPKQQEGQQQALVRAQTL